MNTLRNSVQLVGHLGKNPEITNLEKGKKLARVSIAVNEFYTSAAGEKVEQTNWINLVAWDNTATYMERNLSKGNQVLIKGSLSSRNYEDKQGVKKYITEVVVSEVLKMQKDEPVTAL
ncbi:MAG: single-stranded DNA-binding protein [Saprospiraceae bacterium]|nr:single-stranded DNA-binding protein [Saprospiraceae bacterium]